MKFSYPPKNVEEYDKTLKNLRELGYQDEAFMYKRLFLGIAYGFKKDTKESYITPKNK